MNKFTINLVLKIMIKEPKFFTNSRLKSSYILRLINTLIHGVK